MEELVLELLEEMRLRVLFKLRSSSCAPALLFSIEVVLCKLRSSESLEVLCKLRSSKSLEVLCKVGEA